jgi:hypothetical protein
MVVMVTVFYCGGGGGGGSSSHSSSSTTESTSSKGDVYKHHKREKSVCTFRCPHAFSLLVFFKLFIVKEYKVWHKIFIALRSITFP